MPLLAAVGEMGKGKTLCGAYAALQAHLAGKKIFSNIKLFGIPFTPIHSTAAIESADNGFVLLDELPLWIDCRQSFSKKNRVLTRILTRSRKKHLDIFATAQTLGMLDNRYRDNCEITILPEFLDSENVRLTAYHRLTPIGLPHLFNPALVYPIFDTNELVYDIKEYEETENPYTDYEVDIEGETWISTGQNEAFINWLLDKGKTEKEILKICSIIDKELKKPN